jgi:hypothetical protein
VLVTLVVADIQRRATNQPALSTSHPPA